MASRDIPIEVIDLILSRLPAKSLLRFRCVRKAWRHLISAPEFIKRFHDDKLHEHILTQHDSVYSLHRIIGTHGIVVTRTRFLFPFRIVQIDGCSNGLVCFRSSYDGFHVHLWNPCIGKFKAVPKPLISMQCDTKLVLCFLARFNDYRLVKIPDGGNEKSEIYSLRTNSWRLIENDAPMYETINATFCDVNGVIYAMALQFNDNNLCEEILITFDMVEEVFKTIKIRGVINDYDFSWHLVYPVIFGTSLFLVDVRDKNPDIDVEGQDIEVVADKVHVWERTVHDDATESWTKNHSIYNRVNPVGFLKNGEMVCIVDGTRISSYDPRISGKLRDLPFARISHHFKNLISCVGGLGSNSQMYKINGTANSNAIRAAAEQGVKRFVYVSATDFGLLNYLLQGYYEGKRAAETEILTKLP